MADIRLIVSENSWWQADPIPNIRKLHQLLLQNIAKLCNLISNLGLEYSCGGAI